MGQPRRVQLAADIQVLPARAPDRSKGAAGRLGWFTDGFIPGSTAVGQLVRGVISTALIFTAIEHVHKSHGQHLPSALKDSLAAPHGRANAREPRLHVHSITEGNRLTDLQADFADMLQPAGSFQARREQIGRRPSFNGRLNRHADVLDRAKQAVGIAFVIARNDGYAKWIGHGSPHGLAALARRRMAGLAAGCVAGGCRLLRQVKPDKPCRRLMAPDHERLHWRLDGDDGVQLPGGEAAKLARPNPVALTVHLHDQRALQHHKALVTEQMQVRLFTFPHPALIGVVVPNLQAFRLKTGRVAWHTAR